LGFYFYLLTFFGFGFELFSLFSMSPAFWAMAIMSLAMDTL